MKLHKFKSDFKFERVEEKGHLSPKRSDYEELAVVKPDGHSKCSFIDPKTNKRCKLFLEMYPKFCHLHTILTVTYFKENVYRMKIKTLKHFEINRSRN